MTRLLTKGAKALQTPCAPIDCIDTRVQHTVQTLAKVLAEYREKTGFGRAIAAPQIGVLQRVIVMNLGAGPIALINPEITWRSDSMQWVWDDCLSVPDCIVQVERHQSISVRYQDMHGRYRHWERMPADMAELLQHEMDHLDGVLMTDRVKSERAIRPIRERETLIGQQRNGTRLRVDHVNEAADVIDPVFLQTPQYRVPVLQDQLGCNVLFKVETQNPIRSFKGRGADYLLRRLLSTENPSHLVSASAGNWGQALAYVNRSHRLPLTIYASKNANPLKIERMRGFGATVRLAGDNFDEAKSFAKTFATESGGLFLEDGASPEIAEGHATMACEILSDAEHVDAIIAPLGNGALLNGLGLWAKAKDPATKIIGVCAQGAVSMRDSWLALKAGGPLVEYQTSATIADGIDVRIPVPEAVMDMCRLTDEIDVVTDAQMIAAMGWAMTHLGLILEPAGAAGLATLLAHQERYAGKNLAVVLTGSNLTTEQHKAWLSR